MNKVTSHLTDGGGVSELTKSKVLKDFVADLLLSGAAALVAVNVVDLPTAVHEPTVAAMAIGGAAIRVVFRAVLRWTQS